ncbi:MAG: hypothetical protein WCN92_05585 [Eubacteriales bacterium]
MKRIFELVMVVCLLLGILCACDKGTNTKTTKATTVADTATTAVVNDIAETIGEKQLNGLCEPLAALYTVYADPTNGLNYTAGKVENKDAVTYLDYLGAMFYAFDAQEYNQLPKGVKYVSGPEIDVTQLLDVVYGNFFTTADILTDNNLLIFNGHAYYVPVLDAPKAEVKYIGGELPLMTDTLNYSVKVDYNDGTVVEGTMKVKVAQSENNQYWMTITSISATDIKVVESAG